MVLEGFTIESVNSDRLVEISKESSTLAIPRLPDEVLMRINTTYELYRTKEILSKMDKVDFGFATEVFTMLPLDNNVVEKSKLTSTPSTINKEVVMKVLDNKLDVHIDKAILDRIVEVRNMLENVVEDIDEIAECVTQFRNELARLLEGRESKALVIYKDYNGENKTLDLINSSISDVVLINDREVFYEKYNGESVSRFMKAAYDEGLKLILEILGFKEPNTFDVSLESFMQLGYDLLVFLGRYKGSVLEYKNLTSNLDIGNLEVNEKVVDAVNGFNEVVRVIETVNKLKSIVRRENNIFVKVLELVKFLD